MQKTDYDAKPIVLAVTSLILAVPFPILIIVLWTTVSTIKSNGEAISNLTMNAVFLYLVQFFVIPIVVLTSVIIALIGTAKWTGKVRTVCYAALCLTASGVVILGLFLNRT